MCNNKNGILVIKREPIQDVFGPNTSCSEELGITVHDIHQYYHGFEGRSWPYYEYFFTEREFNIDELVPLDMYSDVAKYLSIIQHNHPNDQIDCLYLHLAGDNPKKTIMQNLVFIGVEYGYYISQYNHYSVLFHEIICGKNIKMISFIKYLNNYLLFPADKDLLSNIKKEREILLQEGADLETSDSDDEAMIPIYIYRLEL